MVLLNILLFVLVLSLVIFIHELGHFIMAKRAGILCHEFAIGMGPIVYSKKKGETLYSIRAIPLGGFVSMAGEELNDEMVKIGQTVKLDRDENGKIINIVLNTSDPNYAHLEEEVVTFVDLQGKDDGDLMVNHSIVDEKAYYIFKDKKLQVAPYNRSFESKSLLQRFLAIVAGPVMNFILAFIIFVIIALIVGFPVLDSNELGGVSDTMPAGEILEVGDQITAVNGVNVDTWEDFTDQMRLNEGLRDIELTVERDGAILTYTINPRIFIYSIGINSHPDTINEVKIGEVVEGTLAHEAGLKGNDVILGVNNQPVNNWRELITIMRANTEGRSMTFEILRNDEVLTFDIRPYDEALLETQGVNIVDSVIGVNPTTEPNALASFGSGLTGVKNAGTMVFDTLDLLFRSDRVGVGDLAGPIGIYSITSQAASQGFVTLLNWVALLSVNLGIINLLPIPALDGGRIVFLGYEAITRRKVNKRVENTLHFIMFILLMGLFVFVAYNDILRLFNLG